MASSLVFHSGTVFKSANPGRKTRVSCFSSSSAPWLMLPPAVDGTSRSIAYKFHPLDKKKNKNKKEDLIQYTSSNIGGDSDDELDVEFVGSSHWWLALYNRNNSDLFLSNPISGRHIKLPSLPAAPDRVILSSEEEEEGSAALMSFGWRGGLALCSPSSSDEWTPLGGGGGKCENLTYSSTHKRLFCLRRDDETYHTSVECWFVGKNSPPRRDWMMRMLDMMLRPHGDSAFLSKLECPGVWPWFWGLKAECRQINYLVCSEHSGELFFVVRHVNPRAGPHGYLVDELVLSKHRGCHYIRTLRGRRGHPHGGFLRRAGYVYRNQPSVCGEGGGG